MFSRRGFLTAASASAGLFFLPRSVFADSPDDVVLRAAIVSDVHYKSTLDTPETERFERMMQFVYEYSETQPYKNFDGLLIVGDMADTGKIEQSGLVRQSLNKFLKPETKRVFCMGNHDCYHASHQIWEEVFEQPANKRVEINGYQFITLSCEKGTMRNGDYKYAMPWLKEQLDAACADNSNKPVFLIQHYPVKGTVYGSDLWGTDELADLLKKYPRLIDFAGHSHYPTVDPRSAWQGEFTAFGTGTMSYYIMPYGQYARPNGYRTAGNAYIMEIHADNSVVLKVYDAVTNRFFDCVYVVAQPGNVDKFIYTNKRYETSKPPYWEEGVKASVSDVSFDNATLTFPQAQWDEQQNRVHSYKIDLSRKVKDPQSGVESWIQLPSRYEWSYYFFNDRPANISVSYDRLNWNSQYRYCVTALNCFGKESQMKLEGEFSTPENPDECVDQNALKPQANVLDVHFTLDGPVNTAVNRLSVQKPVEVLGTPKFVEDAEAGAVVAVFDGVKDYCKIKFTKEDYSKLTKAITYTSKFKLDKLASGGLQPFGNTELGGYNFRIDGNNKVLQIWIEIENKYHVLTTPVEAGKYYCAACVYDGKDVVVYLDGVEKVRKTVSAFTNGDSWISNEEFQKKVSARITYPDSPESHAFTVGSDISKVGKGDFFFPGSVVYARVYSWALTPEQVKAISD